MTALDNFLKDERIPELTPQTVDKVYDGIRERVDRVNCANDNILKEIQA
jgi:hypothetical protein